MSHAPCANFQMPRSQQKLREFYRTLYRAWGPQHWWPAQSPFEVIVGAYLTQNTAWTNVERALQQLRAANALSIEGIRRTPLRALERLIRSAGYFRQKAQRLKTFVAFLDKNYGGSLDRMFAEPTAKLREELLALNGVGLETADSILLYAGNHPVFVVDAYTRRILLRHGIIDEKTSYEEIRAMIEQAISNSAAESLTVKNAFSDPRHPVSRMSSSARSELAQHYNELHALIVRVGNHYCRTKPICEGCPLQKFLKNGCGATVDGALESY